MRILSLIFIFNFCISSAFAENNEEFKNSNYPIDWKYKAGEYLIYDCERSYYACVDKEGQETCKKERNAALENKSKDLKCASLKKFQNKKSCVIENYNVLYRNAFRRFCYPKN